MKVYGPSLAEIEVFSSMGSMKTGHSSILSFLGLIIFVIPIFADENSHDYPTHRPNQEESTGKLWVPSNAEESWTGMSLENADQREMERTIDCFQNIADGSRVFPKRHIVDWTAETDPLSETDPTDSSTLMRRQLQKRSCEVEASKFGHDREIGATALVAHEIFCEADKLLRYAWISVQNLKYEVGLDELLDAETQGRRLISLKHLHSGKSLSEVVEYYLTRFQRFLTNPEYLEYLTVAVQNSVPVAEIRETWGRLEMAVENLVDRVAERVESRLDLHIGTDANFATQLRDEILVAKEDALRFIREYLSNSIEGNQLQRAASFVEWLFDRFLESGSFHRYFPVLKEAADALQDFYRGFHASRFQEGIIAPVRNFISTSLEDVREIPSANRILSDGQHLVATIFHPVTTLLGKSLSPIPYDVSSRVARRSFEPDNSSFTPESMIFPPLSIFVGNSSSARVESSPSPTRTSISDHVLGTSATDMVTTVEETEETEETSTLSIVSSSSSAYYAASSPLIPSSTKNEVNLPFPAVYRRLQTTSREHS